MDTLNRPSDSDRTPLPGDVVVSLEPGGKSVYLVQQTPARAQLRMLSREQAWQIASRFAQSAGVNLWFREARTIRLLEAYRIAQASPA